MKKLMIIAAALMLSCVAQADSFQDEWNEYCTKIKECTMQKMGENPDDMPEAMRDMVMQSMDGMCASMENQFTEAQQTEYQDIANAGAECLRSLNELTCDQMTEGQQQFETEACQEYQEMAENHPSNQ
ncbi:MAG: hypothetical protein ACFHHU_12890 [Porticoccaceae bacterium]